MIEVELTTTQAIFTEELVELVGLDVNEAYRAAAILRSIVDPQVLGRAETKAVQMLESADADDLTFTRLGHLLKGLNPGSVEIVIEVALARDNPDLDEVVAVLRRPSPRWRI